MSDDYSRYEKMCGDKRPHNTREEAIQHCEEERKRDHNLYLNTYLCFFCEKWHVGHAKRKKKKKKKKFSLTGG
jgi:hypothetical protein